MNLRHLVVPESKEVLKTNKQTKIKQTILVGNVRGTQVNLMAQTGTISPTE
jgi:hypothetical protein